MLSSYAHPFLHTQKKRNDDDDGLIRFQIGYDPVFISSDLEIIQTLFSTNDETHQANGTLSTTQTASMLERFSVQGIPAW